MGGSKLPKRDTIVARKKTQFSKSPKETAELRVCLNLSSITRTSAMQLLKIFLNRQKQVAFDY